jgi:RNA polymerase sigma-70 factor, ECF subfamily
LAKDVTAYADGGGKITAAVQPIVGLENVIQYHAALAQVYAERKSQLVQYGLINGLPGFVTVEHDNPHQTTALQIEDGKIVGIYVMRNPEKLRHLDHGSIH